MRFTAAAVLASGAMAAVYPVSTDYTTQVITVTNCPSSVLDCPAHQKTTAVVSTVLPLTTSTVYSTKVHTITSCAADVVNCPARSTAYSTETIAAYTTVCPVGAQVTSTAQPWGNNTVVVPPTGPKPSTIPTESQKVPQGPGSSKPAPQGPATTAAACQADVVTAITKSYTTVLTTVEYSTIKGSCPTGQAGVPTGAVPPPAKSTPGSGCTGPNCPPPAQSTGGAGCRGANCTTTTPPPVTAGAASFAGSALFAAAAGVAAYVFA